MNKRAVRVQLRGGLGNQLFQYGTGLALSRRLDLNLQLDCSLLPETEVTQGGVARWPEQISSFDYEGVLINRGLGKGKYWFRTRQAQLERAIGDLFPSMVHSMGLYAHERDDPIAPLTNKNPPLRINAYCNSPIFFNSIGGELRDQIRKLVKPSDWYVETSQQISETEPIAVHLRLGDYKNLESVYGTLTRSYFDGSKQVIEKLTPSRGYLIFSDEPDLAKEFFRGTSLDAEVVYAPRLSSPIESVLLMSQCEGLIASNSSYSWWAAYMMAGRSTPVVFPRPLFKSPSRPEPKDWLLDHWLQIGNNA